MLTVTITIAAFLGLSVVSYFANEYRKSAADYQAKFESTKQFADEAGKTILKLEQRNKDFSNTIVMLKAEVAALQVSKAAKEVSKQPVNDQITDAVTNNKPAGKKRGPKPGRHNHSK